ncbi:MAG TPA: hypothetical protein ENI56_02330 [Candidatus Kaiserbacteria bacterium]|nr:hypothetical protein [Candidatus Kaiserbacteria bacterium]
MKNESSFNLILIGFIVIVALAGGYLYVTSVSTPLTPLTTITTTATTDLFSNIGSIQLNTNILSNPRFRALTDITIPVGQEPMGRTDPFASFH